MRKKKEPSIISLSACRPTRSDQKKMYCFFHLEKNRKGTFDRRNRHHCVSFVEQSQSSTTASKSTIVGGGGGGGKLKFYHSCEEK